MGNSVITLPSRKVAIEPIYDPDKIGSIWIPDQAKMRCDQGIVKYVGAKVKEVEIGDYVIFSGYSGTNVEIEGEGRLIIMLEKFIVCKLYPPGTIVPGLYFKYKENGKYVYEEATHEEAFHQISLAFQESPFRQKVGLVDRRSLPDVPYTEELTDDEEDE